MSVSRPHTLTEGTSELNENFLFLKFWLFGPPECKSMLRFLITDKNKMGFVSCVIIDRERSDLED